MQTPGALLTTTPWFKTLSMQQQDALAFSLALQEQPAFRAFPDCRQLFGRPRASHLNADGKRIPPTMVLSQCLMHLPGSTADDAPSTENLGLALGDNQKRARMMLGREYPCIQGFPIDLIEKMDSRPRTSRPARFFSERTMADLPGDGLSIPISLALIMSAMATLPWQMQEKQ